VTVPETCLTAADASAATMLASEAKRRESVHDRVEEVLASVSEADRILLVLKEVEGLSIPELEQVYRVSQGALEVRLFRARQRILQALGEERAPSRSSVRTAKVRMAHS
jgi:RNA polymerase sigma-70 factor (ECF subfamily)